MNARFEKSSSALSEPTTPKKDAKSPARHHKGLPSDALKWAIGYSAVPAIQVSWWSLVGGLSGMLLGMILVKVAGRKLSLPLHEGLSALAKIMGVLAGYAVVCGVLGTFARSFPPLCFAALIGVLSLLFVTCLWRVPAWIGRRLPSGGIGRRCVGALVGAASNLVVTALYVLILGAIIAVGEALQLAVAASGKIERTCATAAPS
jgi:hypothetical protein